MEHIEQDMRESMAFSHILSARAGALMPRLHSRCKWATVILFRGCEATEDDQNLTVHSSSQRSHKQTQRRTVAGGGGMADRWMGGGDLCHSGSSMKGKKTTPTNWILLKRHPSPWALFDKLSCKCITFTHHLLPATMTQRHISALQTFLFCKWNWRIV